MRVEKNRPETKAPTSSRQMEKLVGRFDRYSERWGDALVDRFGEETVVVMRGEMLDEYRRLIPEVPYIGGWRNSKSGHLSFAARALALYRVVIRHGGSLEDTGELLHRTAQAETERFPRVVRHGAGRYYFTRLRRWRLERAARKSQARRYPGDWVFERIDGDGETFDFGMDTTECGIVKFFHAQEADELGPYLCDLDYVKYEGIGTGLRRTKTLAWGCDRCDFRYSKQGVTSAPWPPEFVERTCGQPQPGASSEATGR
ncbi:MAG: L-2-amino-thiazoline-4-carboxylic acid hydrolase [Actinomycetota bacterium]|nr:L-2-amino-thiazoline-4-carboxylic acid hydrolase [Actinomycetota bacterium]